MISPPQQVFTLFMASKLSLPLYKLYFYDRPVKGEETKSVYENAGNTSTPLVEVQKSHTISNPSYSHVSVENAPSRSLQSYASASDYEMASYSFADDLKTRSRESSIGITLGKELRLHIFIKQLFSSLCHCRELLHARRENPAHEPV